jgi:fructokinase
MDLICLGELLIDMFPAELGRPHAEVSAFRPVPGGAPANAAVAARRLGAETAFIGKVGDDPFGHFLVDVLAREGVETRGMRLDPEARTTMNLMAQPDANHYDCLFYRNPGADTRLRPDELDAALLRSTRAFHFGSLSLTDEPARSATVEAVKIAEASGALISYDVNYRPTLWKSPEEAAAQARAMIRYADLVKVNEAELALLAGEGDPSMSSGQALATASGALLGMGPSLCVVTLGPGGSYYRVAAGGATVPGFPVETVDATGCGDAFIAGLLWQLVKAGDWRGQLTPERLTAALCYANAVGALTATKQGVIPSLPTAAEVEAFLTVR